MKPIKIVEAEYVNFGGFVVSKIKRIVVVMDEVLQILNSTNGSGKSTFIQELNPFSVDKELWAKDGFKRIVWDIDGDLYQTTCGPTINSVVCLRDNVELNKSGTITEHNTIIERLFGLTPYMWAIAMGGLQFTKQDKNARRKWIETISGVDFTYAFSTYDRLVKLVSGQKQATKIFKQDLVAAEERKGVEIDIESVQAEHDKLTDAVTTLMRLSPNSRESVQYYQNCISIERATAEKIYAKFLKARKAVEDTQVTSIDEANAQIDKHRQNIGRFEGTIDGVLENLKRQADLLDKQKRSGSLSAEELERRINHIKGEQADLKKKIGENLVPQYRVPRELETIKKALSTIDLIDEISEIVATDGLGDKHINCGIEENEYYASRAQLDQISSELPRLDLLINDYEEHIFEIVSAKDVECPKCGHGFGSGSHNLESIKSKLANTTARKAELTEKAVELTELVSRYDSAAAARMRLYDHLGRLHASISSMAIESINNSVPFSLVVRNIKSVKVVLECYAKGIALKEEADVYKASLESMKTLSEMYGDADIEKEMELNESKLADLNMAISAEQEAINYLGKVIKHAQEAHSLCGEFIDCWAKVNSLYRELVDAVNSEVGDSFVRRMQTKLATTASILNSHDADVRLVNRLKLTVSNAEKKLVACRDIHKALNPTTGIIGEQVTKYCEEFARQVTCVLEDVWGYPMVVEPPKVSNKGVDYKFPVKFEAGRSSDIAKTSKSQQAIINLAVSMCTRYALGVSHIPVFFDEVSDGMDEHHARAIRDYIVDVIHSGDVRTVLFVDHAVANRSRLGDYDEVVFNKDQITTSDGYNKNVTIERY